MTSLNIKSYLRTLEQNPEYVDLLAQVNQLNKIEQTIIATDAIPAPLNRHCKLGPLSHGTLVLLAENASVATKLKHISPSILSKIRRSEWKITAVKIKLQKPDSNSHNRATQNQTINFYANNMHKKSSVNQELKAFTILRVHYPFLNSDAAYKLYSRSVAAVSKDVV